MSSPVGRNPDHIAALLEDCAREPIHVPGAIQAHGVLLVLREPSLVIEQVSVNTSHFLGREAESLLGLPIEKVLHPEVAKDVRNKLLSVQLKSTNPIRVTVEVHGELRTFNGIAHRHRGLLVLELEEARLSHYDPFLSFYHPVRESISRLREAKNLRDLCTAAVEEVQGLSGFDRVVIYRFDRDWNGEVIAETLAHDIDSHMGLRFPASDIPRQARDLYFLNPIRYIPDVHYTPASLLPVITPSTGEPLDMSYGVLRSVSPIHREYLHNMGCTASLSISLVKEGKLWGLISCTHTRGPKPVPFELRSLCEFVGEIMSSLLSVYERDEHFDTRIRTKSLHATLLERMTLQGDFVRGLTEGSTLLLDLVEAQGAAVYFNGHFHVIGEAPSDAQLESLIQWLAQRDDDPLVTDSLPQLFPEAEAFKDIASGLLAAPLSRGKHNYVLWFRPEVIQTIHWGGNPYKAVQADTKRLHPRKSFELWKERVSLHSLPWKAHQVDAAIELRKAIKEVVLQKSEELLALNEELRRSNLELDSFAYAASHDLKEPLRGIHNYANFVLRESDGQLVGASQGRLETIVRLSQRMEALINSLLHYSQVGRVNLSMRPTDLNDVLGQVLEQLRLRLEENHASVRLPRKLPVVPCDRVRVAEVFSNLISNGIKYNDSPQKEIEVGFLEPTSSDQPVFYVRDNGIGIDRQHHDTIFKIFRRLHQRDKYGGGTGTGLTIAKRIVERHHGRMSVESSDTEGSTFYFTLGGEQQNDHSQPMLHPGGGG